MHHSGSKLQYLNVASCRHISHNALYAVFAEDATYPHLREIDVSFVNAVDTAILAAIFKSCPSLSRVVAFGCFGADDIVVPRGVVVVGLPRAQDAIERFGGEGANALGVDDAVIAMLNRLENDVKVLADDGANAEAGDLEEAVQRSMDDRMDWEVDGPD